MRYDSREVDHGVSQTQLIFSCRPELIGRIQFLTIGSLGNDADKHLMTLDHVIILKFHVKRSEINKAVVNFESSLF